MFFENALESCEVKWSKRMTLCAGLCVYQRAGQYKGFCSVRLSEPLLKLRPRSDLINTLLHEMIHAYIFLKSTVRDHDDHGPIFQYHMNRINEQGNARITIYHTFHDEVDNYRQHWWKCNGICQSKRPYYGIVKRAMNRPPGPYDSWWKDHETSCGGQFIKIKEPEKVKKIKKNVGTKRKIENMLCNEGPIDKYIHKAKDIVTTKDEIRQARIRALSHKSDFANESNTSSEIIDICESGDIKSDAFLCKNECAAETKKSNEIVDLTLSP